MTLKTVTVEVRQDIDMTFDKGKLTDDVTRNPLDESGLRIKPARRLGANFKSGILKGSSGFGIMRDFRQGFFPFQTIDDHVTCFARLSAIGAIGDDPPDQFVQGYGPLHQMGISCRRGAGGGIGDRGQVGPS